VKIPVQRIELDITETGYARDQVLVGRGCRKWTGARNTAGICKCAPVNGIVDGSPEAYIGEKWAAGIQRQRID
jgi:hypothetical protein